LGDPVALAGVVRADPDPDHRQDRHDDRHDPEPTSHLDLLCLDCLHVGGTM